MTPEDYQQVRIGLDRALFVFHEAEASLTPHDKQLRLQVATLRAQILKAESGHPFAVDEQAEADPDTTRAPFFRASTSNEKAGL